MLLEEFRSQQWEVQQVHDNGGMNEWFDFQVIAMVEGRDRRPELGYKLAMELKNAMDETQWTKHGLTDIH